MSYKTLKNSLTGLCVTYLDDVLKSGNEEFSNFVRKTEETFECKSRDYDNLQLAGMEVESRDNGFEVHQKSYLSKLPKLERIQLPNNADRGEPNFHGQLTVRRTCLAQ